MATYTRSSRIKKAYKSCRGLYIGMGPVDCKPKRIKITAFWIKSKRASHRDHRMNMMLVLM